MDGTPALDTTGEGDLLAETQGLGRRVRPEAVNYAKRAKRVDVRKLKENIWKELKIVTGHKREDSPLVSCLSVHSILQSHCCHSTRSPKRNRS
jgi:hypothetical protein